VRVTAYIDESESRQDVDPGAYLLCAALLADDDRDRHRGRMLALKRPGQKKVHWHEESTDAGRMALVDAIADAGGEYLAVVRVGDASTRIERRRRLCLERLCYELHILGVEEMILESRGPADRLDRALLDSLRAKKAVDGTLRMDHEPGPAEPLLWIPDIVCGALTQDRIGNTELLDPLRSKLTLIEV